MGIAHWDDVECDLGEAAGSLNVSVRRVRIAPDDISTQLVDPLGEEIIFVLEGSGLSRQDDKTYEVRVGDCIVHGATTEAHALRAGGHGLTVLAYGIHTRTPGAADPELDWPEASPRPPNILNLDEADVGYEGERGRWIRFAVQAGAVRSGLNWGRLEPGCAGARPHCHSAEEEVFVVLEGGGTLDLWPSPARAANPREQHELRAGHVIARPPGTGISHSFTAGDAGMTFLLYGTREPNDICYYPRSNKIYWRGVGLITRLEPLDYDDGEPEE